MGDCSSNNDRSKGKLIVIDTDAGVDDALAVLVALGKRPLNVLAITTVFGNTSVDQVCRNVLRTLFVANRLDIPVYRGAERSVCGHDAVDVAYCHGGDGLGDAMDPESLPTRDLSYLIQPGQAAVELVRLVNQYPGQISLLCLAPLTNVALALQLDSDFGKKLHDCCIMGGNYTGRGNITPSAEYNFYTDPEAADVTLKYLHCPITLITWELCLDWAILPWDLFDEYTTVQSVKGRFVRAITVNPVKEYYQDRKQDAQKRPGYILCDEVVSALAIDQRVVAESIDIKCVGVELNGRLTRGQLVLYWPDAVDAQSPALGKSTDKMIRLVTKLNREVLLQVMLDSVTDSDLPTKPDDGAS